MIFSEVINPYEELIKYEVEWASNKNSSLKNIANSEKSLFGLELQEKITSFFSKIERNFIILTQKDIQFPKKLKETYIKTLYCKGDVDLLNAPKKISIVGTRNPTKKGIENAKRIAKRLTQEGFVIVSGLAQGIDTVAMEEVLKNNGHLIGVIGTPINKYYPKENKDLQDEVAKNHLLVSHVPFYKYSIQRFDTQKFYFPERNAVMAGISDATIIVEAGETSGTQTQARACIEMNRPLFILDDCFEKGLKWAYSYEKKGAIRVGNMKEILNKLS